MGSSSLTNDGLIDEIGGQGERREALDGWEVLNEPPRPPGAGPSRGSNLTLQSQFNVRIARIPLLDHEMRLRGRRRKYDTRVDPFPILAPRESVSPSDSERSTDTPRPASPLANLRSYTPSISSFRARPLLDDSTQDQVSVMYI